MSNPKPPLLPAEVVAAMERAEALLKAARPLLKAKRIDWHKVRQVLYMAEREISEPCSTILDWDMEQMRIARGTTE